MENNTEKNSFTARASPQNDTQGNRLTPVTSVHVSWANLAKEASDTGGEDKNCKLKHCHANGTLQRTCSHTCQAKSSAHGPYGYGKSNEEGETILRTCAAADLAVVNTFFTKKPEYLITYGALPELIIY